MQLTPDPAERNGAGDVLPADDNASSRSGIFPFIVLGASTPEEGESEQKRKSGDALARQRAGYSVWRRGAVLAALALLPTSTAVAGIDQQNAGYRFEIFTDSDDVRVFSMIGDYFLEFSEQLKMTLGWNRERVVIPGVAAPSGTQEAVDSISGASRPISATEDPFADYTKIRQQVDTRLSFRGISAGYYVSDESDYFAQQVLGSYEHGFFDDQLQLAVSGAYGWDRIDPLEDDDTSAESDRRNTTHVSAVATQVLTRTTLAQLGAEWNIVSGLQHNPYRNVYVDGAYVAELHPDRRNRRDVFFKINQYLTNRSSLKGSYKFYTDDWGITSHTVGGKLNQYVTDDFIVRYRYRYYNQNSADFFREEYVNAGGVDGFQTADYRLGRFDAHLFGVKASWNLGRGPLPLEALDGIRANVKYERYFNSNNFSANIFESGLSLSF